MTEYGLKVAEYNRHLAIYNATEDLRAGVNFANLLIPNSLTRSARPITEVVSRMTRGVGRPTLPSRKPDKAFEPIPQESSQVVIGGRKSVPEELNEVFNKLTAYCRASLSVSDHVNDRLRDSEDNLAFRAIFDKFVEPTSATLSAAAAAGAQAPVPPTTAFKLSNPLQFRLRSIRQLLHTTESNKVSSVFDALLSTQVAPLTLAGIYNATSVYHRLSDADKQTEELPGMPGVRLKHYARVYKKVDQAERVERIDSLAGRDNQLTEYLDNLLKTEPPSKVNDTNPYVMMYDRTMYDRLKKTKVSTVLRIKIRDFNGSTTVFEIRPSELYGTVAHSVSSGLVDQVELFEGKTSVDLVNCLYEFYDTGTTRTQKALSMVRSSLSAFGKAVKFFTPNGPVKSELLHWANQSYYWLIAGARFSVKDDMELKIEDLEDRVIELRWQCRSALPPWPPLQEGSLSGPVELLQKDSTPYQEFKPKLDEEMAAFDQRVAQIRPAQPTPENPMLGQMKEFTYASTLGSLDRGRLVAEVAGVETELEFQVASIRKNVEDILSSNDEARASAYLKELKELEETLVSLGILVPKERQNRTYYSSEDTVVVRKLPQIVTTSTMQVRYIPPDAPDPPLFFDFEASSEGSSLRNLKNATVPAAAAAAAQPARAQDATNSVSNTVSSISPGTAVAATVGGAALYTGVVQSLFIVIYELGQFVVYGAQEVTAALSPEAEALAQAAAILTTLFGLAVYVRTRANNRIVIQTNLFTLIATAGLSWLKTWMLENEIRRKVWNQAAKDVRGVPVLQTFASAAAATQAYERRLLKQRESIGLREEVVIRACYNTESGRRFHMTELYLDEPDLRLSLQDTGPVHAGRWWSVPIASALTLLPPSQVSDQIFEVTELRAIPAGRQFAFLGARDAQALPSDLAAKAAVLEIFQAVKRNRRDLKGEHLMSTASQTTQALVADATRIILAAYGPESGTTLVNGDDPIWTCLAGGIAARLALRHYDLFVESEIALSAATPASKVAVAAEFWNRPRRRMMMAFCNSLEVHAEEMTRVATGAGGLADIAEEASGSFYRVRALAAEEIRTEVGMVVGSSVASALGFTDEVAWFQTSVQLGEMADRAASFADQRDYKQPVLSVEEPVLSAAWASRRLAPKVAREFTVVGTPQNLNTIIKDLAGLSIEENPDPKTWLAPYGGRLASLPSQAVDLGGLSSRVVWLGALRDSAQRLEDRVTEASLPEGRTVRVQLTQFRPFERDSVLVGIAKHPLALTRLTDGTIRVRLCGVPSVEPGSVDLPETRGLADAVETLRRLDDQRVVQQRVHLLRILAFNADRVAQACGLAAAAAGRAAYVTIVLPPTYKSAHLTALAMGMAMHLTETGRVITRVRVVNQAGADVDFNMDWLVETTGRALERGCKVVSLAEAALALSGFGPDGGDGADGGDGDDGDDGDDDGDGDDGDDGDDGGDGADAADASDDADDGAGAK
jgi:hypothetical protein